MPQETKQRLNARLNLITAITYLLGFLICGRLFILTVVKHDYYLAKSDIQERLAILQITRRGEIYLKNQKENLYPVAINKGWPMVYAEPNRIESNRKELAEKLSEILNMDKGTILEKIVDRDDPYELIKRKLNEEEQEEIERKIKDKGIKIKTEESLRYYPAGNLACHVIGFLGYKGDERVGQYGIEEYYNSDLSGKTGLYKELDNEETSGSNITLSIDSNIQLFVEERLKKAVENYDAEGGTVVVMNPKSGKIMAMANYPDFDLNQYAKIENFDVFVNSAVSLVFEPGSVFKPITMAIGLDQDKVTPSTSYYDKGYVKIGSHTIYNADQKVYGEQTMTQVLEKSLNTGIVFVADLLEQETVINYLNKFGFGKETGIDLPGEARGNINNLMEGREINFATASFGQGISVTPVQLTRAFSAIANAGMLPAVSVVESIEKGDKIQDVVDQKSQRVISEDTANRLTAMLVNVTEEGTGSQAKIPGYLIATKTGTAQIPLEHARGYSEDEVIHTIVGFGPAYDARFVILVKLDRPHGVKFAARSVAPVFKDIAEQLINYFEISPQI